MLRGRVLRAGTALRAGAGRQPCPSESTPDLTPTGERKRFRSWVQDFTLDKSPHLCYNGVKSLGLRPETRKVAFYGERRLVKADLSTRCGNG